MKLEARTTHTLHITVLRRCTAWASSIDHLSVIIHPFTRPLSKYVLLVCCSRKVRLVTTTKHHHHHHHHEV